MPNTLTAIINARIYTIDKTFTTYRNGTILFDSSGIVAVGDTRTIPVPPTARLINGKGRLAVLPGLIDTHSHSSLLKGYTENAQLMDFKCVEFVEELMYGRYRKKPLTGE